MVVYPMPQQMKKEDSERLRGEGDQIKFIDLRFERGQFVIFRKGRRRQDVLGRSKRRIGFRDFKGDCITLQSMEEIV